jgi:2'-hydroxyisoflavone reductase
VLDRRTFLTTAGLTTAGLAGGALLLGRGARAAPPAGARGAAPQRVLVLGGTGFIGPHLVRGLVARGHAVTIFTRGRRDADLPASVVRLTGDRNGDLRALEGKTWDVVIDDSATNPDWVRQSVALLRGGVGRYLFTSSTGVHYPYLAHGLDERSPVRTELADPKDGAEVFGVNKARCERLVLDAFGDRGLVVRPTYIVGPGDTTDRFPYWPQRLARGGETLAPGRRDDPVQFVDVRDLAAFYVTLVEGGRAGVYEAVGPRARTTMPEFLGAARAALASDARFVWVDDYAFLERHGIGEAIPWAMLKGNDLGMMSIANAKAVGAGLTFRPAADTVRDTLAWWGTTPEARRAAPRFAITPEREAAALAEWKRR